MTDKRQPDGPELDRPQPDRPQPDRDPDGQPPHVLLPAAEAPASAGDADEPTVVQIPLTPPVPDRAPGSAPGTPGSVTAAAGGAPEGGDVRPGDDGPLPTDPGKLADPPVGDDEETARLTGLATAAEPAYDDLDGPTRRLDRDGPEPSRDPVTAAEPAQDDLDGPTRRLDRDGPEPSRDPVTAAGPEEGGAPGVSGKGEPEEADAGGPEEAEAAPRPRLTSAGALILVLLALFGFTLVVQLRSNDGDQGLATARQEDLVRILSDLEARDSRLQTEISALETSQRQLTSGVAGRQTALAEAERRADELGLLAGTLPGRGPGLVISLDEVKASAILNAVQELRGAGGEVMQLAGSDGTMVRIVASSYFVDADGGGIVADGARLAGPYTLSVIGSPQTMQTALQIPGGVVASVNSAGGSVTMEQRSTVEVTAVREATTLQYARPVS